MNNPGEVFVAGGETLIGRALARAFERSGAQVLAPSRDELPITDAAAVDKYFARHRPRRVVVAGGKSGGIGLNQRVPADLMIDNLLLGTSVCTAAARHGVEKLLYLASSCCYPKDCPQPMRVESLGTGPLEPTSEPYAVAKIAGMQLCAALRQQQGVRFITAIPADVFGPDSSFDAEASHVIPALIARMHAAKQRNDPEIKLWGTGEPRREFLFADDLAEACVMVLGCYDGERTINLGGGTELTIRNVAGMIADVVGFRGRLVFDASKPDGMLRKLLDSAVLHDLGWRPVTPVRESLERTYQGFLDRTIKVGNNPEAAR
jgi:GDP-L-fucose synthase